jgi:predicted nucleic acid-binding protein
MTEPDLLLDTDILIEILRGKVEAAVWLAGLGQQVIGISVLVLMEILQGARNRREQDTLVKQLDRYPLIVLEGDDSERALKWLKSYHLSHGVGIMDCLIAASAVRLGKPLYTFNIKHYKVIPNLDGRVPYRRIS